MMVTDKMSYRPNRPNRPIVPIYPILPIFPILTGIIFNTRAVGGGSVAVGGGHIKKTARCRSSEQNTNKKNATPKSRIFRISIN